MKYHILNGDALKQSFPFDHIDGETIVIREAFIDGPVSGVFDATYWSKRRNYIQNAYSDSTSHFNDNVITELEKLQKITSADEVYLWFEDDLFCQCNMWFAVNYILQHGDPVFFRVFPEADNVSWMGFGRANQDSLFQFFQKAVRLTQQDVRHIQMLWKSFVDNDRQRLKELSETECTGIRFQNEVIQAQLDRAPDTSGYSRPQKTLSVLMKEGHPSFFQLYAKFVQREGIYGFGDLQVRNMMKEIKI